MRDDNDELIDLKDDDDELIDVEEVCREIGGSKPVDPSTIYRAIQRGDFDPPYHPVPGISRWSRNRTRARARMIKSGKDPA
jgi:predicted DNA-binding transcriptional regulator AlpA